MSGLKTKASYRFFGRVILAFVAGVHWDVMGGEGGKDVNCRRRPLERGWKEV